MIKNKVAITGMGLVTAIGIDIDETWRNLSLGKSGVKLINRFCTNNMKTKIAAFNPLFDGYKSQREIIQKMMKMAIVEAKSQGNRRIDKMVYCLPNGIFDWSVRLHSQFNPKQLPYNCYQKFGLETSYALELKRDFCIDSVPMLISTACASSATALQMGYRMIQAGEADSVLVAASDCSVSEETIIKFNNLSALSMRNESPGQASRPFSSDRDGFVIGEGAGCMILENLDSAKRNNSRIFGLLSGCGSATDNFHRTKGNPNGQKIIEAMSNAINCAEMSLDDISFVNAHGTSTPENDKLEAQAISSLFDSSEIIVTSMKSMIGHTLNSSGIIQAICSVLSMESNSITPTINYSEPESLYGNVKIANELLKRGRVNSVLSNSFGFGGQNTSLLFTKYI